MVSELSEGTQLASTSTTAGAKVPYLPVDRFSPGLCATALY